MTLVTVAMTASGCADQPSQQEFDAALANFDALPDEVKAYACADDYYAVQYGLEGFVIVERCGSPTAVEISDSRPLSGEFERDQVDYAETFYAENPPVRSDLDRVDVDVLCADDDALIREDIEEWRSRTQFPSWEGVEYVPSVEGELARLRVWQEAACPLVEQ
jgi:hypothetical protein